MILTLNGERPGPKDWGQKDLGSDFLTEHAFAKSRADLTSAGRQPQQGRSSAGARPVAVGRCMGVSPPLLEGWSGRSSALVRLKMLLSRE
jgi:hypothetical protein